MLDRLRRILSRPSQPFPDLPEVILRPIGVVSSPIKETSQLGDASQLDSRIVIRPELTEALLGLGGWSHILVLFWPHRVPEDVRGSRPQLHPRDDPENPLQGVLATRSQIRYNPVLCTAVRLLRVKRNVIHVRGLDAIDGTPVLDIKPYVSRFDSVPDAKMPEWVTREREMGDGK